MIPKPAMLILSALAILACLPKGWATEGIVFVTDELRLGLYESEMTTGRPVRTLTSGSELQILERALRSIRVRTEDGDEGWVKTAYVVTQPPARRRIVPLEARNEQLTQTLATVNARNQTVEEQLNQLNTELEQAKQGITQLPELQSEVTTLRQTLNNYGSRVHSNWLIAATVLAFVAGCLAGYYWLDRRVRKRFGGLRIY